MLSGWLPIDPVEILAAMLLGSINPFSHSESWKRLCYRWGGWKRMRVLLGRDCPWEVARPGIRLVSTVIGHRGAITVVHRADQDLASSILGKDRLLR